tara:strand:- start:826 stop:1107 length:282 start_codon:yes stop_codon:yes gene_type:complete
MAKYNFGSDSFVINTWLNIRSEHKGPGTAGDGDGEAHNTVPYLLATKGVATLRERNNDASGPSEYTHAMHVIMGDKYIENEGNSATKDEGNDD